MFRVYFYNFDYFADIEFASKVEATEYGDSTGFEFVVTPYKS